MPRRPADIHDDDDDDDFDPPLDPEGPDPSDFDDDDQPDLLPCPYCRKLIDEDTPRCPHCGQWISAEDAPSQVSWIVVLIIAALILATGGAYLLGFFRWFS